ncbi:MAG TPA: 3-deoxy-D-manno-octulosonate 8-phosphate phosphatase [Lachnospiraceae bacterium]|nr:3-deoxy-D-manno-octulosonate 8-phosphate phosphatase [Lachnospiraceae bacterium]
MSKKDLKKIRLFAMDVDGTLTDGKIYMGASGEMMKQFDVKDGLGIKLLMHHGIIPAIITGRKSAIVENRCHEIGITEIHQGIKNKAEKLQELMAKYHLQKEEVAYIGDDLNDVSAIRLSGVTFAPADCASQLKPYIDIILTKKAGDSPVREAIDRILEGRIHLEGFLDL